MATVTSYVDDTPSVFTPSHRHYSDSGGVSSGAMYAQQDAPDFGGHIPKTRITSTASDDGGGGHRRFSAAHRTSGDFCAVNGFDSPDAPTATIAASMPRTSFVNVNVSPVKPSHKTHSSCGDSGSQSSDFFESMKEQSEHSLMNMSDNASTHSSSGSGNSCSSGGRQLGSVQRLHHDASLNRGDSVLDGTDLSEPVHKFQQDPHLDTTSEVDPGAKRKSELSTECLSGGQSFPQAEGSTYGTVTYHNSRVPEGNEGFSLASSSGITGSHSSGSGSSNSSCPVSSQMPEMVMQAMQSYNTGAGDGSSTTEFVNHIHHLPAAASQHGYYTMTVPPEGSTATIASSSYLSPTAAPGYIKSTPLVSGHIGVASGTGSPQQPHLPPTNTMSGSMISMSMPRGYTMEYTDSTSTAAPLGPLNMMARHQHQTWTTTQIPSLKNPVGPQMTIPRSFYSPPHTANYNNGQMHAPRGSGSSASGSSQGATPTNSTSFYGIGDPSVIGASQQLHSTFTDGSNVGAGGGSYDVNPDESVFASSMQFHGSNHSHRASLSGASSSPNTNMNTGDGGALQTSRRSPSPVNGTGGSSVQQQPSNIPLVAGPPSQATAQQWPRGSRDPSPGNSSQGGGGAASSHYSATAFGGSNSGSVNNNGASSTPYVNSAPMMPQSGTGNAVFVHVNMGETLSVRLNDNVQHIPGPATVRMVSQNPGLPAPIPLVVPPGHVVQQILDENGVLKHLILSPQTAHPGFASNQAPVAGTPAGNGSGMVPQYQSSAVPNGVSLHQHNSYPQQIPSTSFTNNNNSSNFQSGHIGTQHHRGHHVPAGGGDAHDLGHHHGRMGHNIEDQSVDAEASNEIRKALFDRIKQSVTAYKRGSPPAAAAATHQNVIDSAAQQIQAMNVGHYWGDHHQQPGVMNRFTGAGIADRPYMTVNDFGSPFDRQMMATTEDEDDNGEEYTKLVEHMSKLAAPKLDTCADRYVDIVWQGVDCTEAASAPYPEVEASDFTYEVHLYEGFKSDKRLRVELAVSEGEHKLDQLKPGMEYSVRILAVLNVQGEHDPLIRGQLSEALEFKTRNAVPERPKPPHLDRRTKQSISVRWSNCAANGTQIRAYHVECAPVTQDRQGNFVPDVFIERYVGLNKRFTVQSLEPSSTYAFRVSASNDMGKGPFSEYLLCMTSGQAPSPPNPPMLRSQLPHMLELKWEKRPEDDRFVLQKEDDITGHFVSLYTGAETSHTLMSLPPAKEFKFRLCSSNEDGESKWSRVVAYETAAKVPDKPHKPHTKGKVSATSLKLVWDPPLSDGGSPVSLYHLEMENGDPRHEIYTGVAREHVVSALTPGRAYLFYVSCSNSAGRSPASDCLSVNTLASLPDVSSCPVLVKAKAHSLYVRWTGPSFDGGSPLTDYELQMTTPAETGGSEKQTAVVYHGPNQEVSISSGLLPGRSYVFRVRVHNSVGAGPWSEAVSFSTGAASPSAPSQVHAKAKSSHSIVLSWAEPHSNGTRITEYRVQRAVQHTTAESGINGGTGDHHPDQILPLDKRSIPSVSSSSQSSPSHQSSLSQQHSSSAQDGEFGDFQNVYSGDTQCQCEIGGLRPATLYAFRVQAVNSNGVSKFSQPLCRILTPAAPPAEVDTVSVTAISKSDVLVHWSVPECNGSEVTGFKLDVSPAPHNISSPISLTLSDVLQEDAPLACQYRLTNLKAQSNYKVRLQAWNEVGTSVPGSMTKVTTYSEPPAPPSLECVGTGFNSLTLRWHSSFNTTEQLTYSLQTQNREGTFSPVYDGSLLKQTVRKLAENAQIPFRIRAVSPTGGPGPWSSTHLFQTSHAPPPAMKSTPRASELAPDRWLVEWPVAKVAVSAGEKLRYRLQLHTSKSSSSSDDFKTVYEDGNNSFILSSLPIGYHCRVRLCLVRLLPDGVQIAGPFSSTHTFGTSQPQIALLNAPNENASDLLDESATRRGPLLSADSKIALLVLGVCALVVAILAVLLMYFVDEPTKE